LRARTWIWWIRIRLRGIIVIIKGSVSGARALNRLYDSADRYDLSFGEDGREGRGVEGAAAVARCELGELGVLGEELGHALLELADLDEFTVARLVIVEVGVERFGLWDKVGLCG